MKIVNYIVGYISNGQPPCPVSPHGYTIVGKIIARAILDRLKAHLLFALSPM